MGDIGFPVPLQKALDDFRKWDDRKRKRDEVGNLVIAPLHHYSDMASLIGIVEKSQLWLTSVFHLNDPSELLHGLEIAMDRLDWHIAKPVSGKTSNDLAPLVLDAFCERMKHALAHDIGSAFGFYVASFSQTRDDLGQWRAYADDGRGVSIEVSPVWFKPAEPPADAPVEDRYFVSQVVYDVKTAKRRQHSAIDRAVAIVRTAAPSLVGAKQIRDRFLRELEIALAVPLIWNSLTTKHRSYSHEKETRLILINDVSKLAPLVKTRTRGSQIVSYVPIRLPLKERGVLRHVLIGPAALGKPESGVESLLRANGIDPRGRVSQSSIPYRP